MATKKRTRTESTENTETTPKATRTRSVATPTAAAATPASAKQPKATAPAVVGHMEETIRARAYQLYEQRGRTHGHDVQDWLQAEAETLARYGSAFTSTSASRGHSVQ